MSSLLVELVLKAAYVLALVANIVGLVMGLALLRQLALAACPAILFMLLLSWRVRLGWVADSYAYGVLAGLALLLLGDVVMAEPIIDFLSFTGFAAYLCALLVFAGALSTPSSVTASYEEAAFRGAGEAWPLRPGSGAHPLPHRAGTRGGGASGSGGTAPPVPFRFWRGAPAVVCACIGLGLWRAADGATVVQDSRFVAACCMFIVQSFVMWRALARVGYQAPLVTVAGLLLARRRQRALMEIVEDEVLRRQQQAQFLNEAPGDGSLHFLDAAGGGGADAFALDEALLEDEDYWSDGSVEGQGGSGGGPLRGALSLLGSAFGGGSGSNSGSSSSRSGGGSSSSRFGGVGKKTLRTLRAQRRSRNRRQLADDFSGVESRWWQWCAVAGVAMISGGLVALGYDRLWLNDDPDTDGYASFEASALTYTYTLLAWLGQTLLVASVPCRLPPTSSLDDPRVSLPPTDGSPLRVVVILPAEGTYDVAEVAVPWYVLTRRGHSVAFATRDGTPGLLLRHGLPLPWEVSVHGYGCGAGWTDAEGGACCCCFPLGATAAEFAQLRPIAGSAPDADASSPLWAACAKALYALFCCCCCCCRGCGRGRRRGGVPVSSMCCGSDLCSFSSVGFGIGAPGPLVVAMYREMLEDPSFRRPYAWSSKGIVKSYSALPKRLRRRRRKRRSSGSSGNSGSGGGRSGGSPSPSSGSPRAVAVDASLTDGSTSGSDAEAAVQEQLLVPDSFDGMIIVGAHPPASAGGVWDDPDLQGVASDFWGTGRPIATFSSAAVLVAAARTRSGVPLCADSMLTAVPRGVEWALAWTLAALRGSFGALCALAGCCRCCCARARGGGGGRQVGGGSVPTVQARVTASLSNPANFVPGPPAFSLSAILSSLVRNELSFIRPPGPLLSGVCDDPSARCVVVEDGRFLSAQCGSDAFLLARRFLHKLEEVPQRL